MRSIALRMSNAGAAGVATPIPPSSSAASPPALDTALANRAVGAWRTLHRLLKPLEKKVEAARARVFKLISDAGVQEFASKHGVIKVRTKPVTDWEGLARSVIAADVVEAKKAEFTKPSAPFIQALPSWGSDK